MTLVSDVAVVLLAAQERVRLDSGRRKTAVSAAALIDLAQADRIVVAQARAHRPDLLAVASAEPTGDAVLDACLARAARTAPAGADVLVGAGSLHTWQPVIDQLAGRGVVAQTVRRLGPVRRTTTRLASPDGAASLLREIAAAQEPGRGPSSRTLGLTGVLDSSRLWRSVIGRTAPRLARDSREAAAWRAAGLPEGQAATAAAIVAGLSVAAHPS